MDWLELTENSTITMAQALICLTVGSYLLSRRRASAPTRWLALGALALAASYVFTFLSAAIHPWDSILFHLSNPFGQMAAGALLMFGVSFPKANKTRGYRLLQWTVFIVPAVELAGWAWLSVLMLRGRESWDMRFFHAQLWCVNLFDVLVTVVFVVKAVRRVRARLWDGQEGRHTRAAIAFCAIPLMFWPFPCAGSCPPRASCRCNPRWPSRGSAGWQSSSSSWSSTSTPPQSRRT